MRSTAIVGVVLIVLGIAALADQGINQVVSYLTLCDDSISTTPVSSPGILI